MYARPQPNGNSKKDFVAAYAGLGEAKDALQKSLGLMHSNVVHGRNYQHLSGDHASIARLKDLDQIEYLINAIEGILKTRREIEIVIANAEKE